MMDEKAKEYWTILDNLAEAKNAFILSDGSIIDMIHDGKLYGHDEVYRAWSTEYEGFYPFLKNCAAIRFYHSCEMVLLETIRRPSEKQVEVIIQYIQERPPGKLILLRYNGILAGHPDDYGHGYCVYTTNKPRPVDVHTWMNKAFF